MIFVAEHPIEFFVVPPVVVLIGLALERWWLRATQRLPVNLGFTVQDLHTNI